MAIFAQRFLPHKVILFCRKKMKFVRNTRISSGGTLTNWVVAYLTNEKTLPKAQRTRGLSSAYQSNFFRSYHKFLHKSWSNIFRISTKHQLQNLNQASAFWRNLNLKLLTKPIFRILTKIELHNHMKHQQQNNDQTKIHLGFNILQNISRKELTKLQLQILPELQLQNLDQTFCSKSEQTFRFLTKPRLPNLQQIVTNTIIISNSYNINKFWVGIFTRQGHINKVY